MGKQTLYLLQYNNYYNRIVKRYDTLDEYLANEMILATYNELNFIPNDGVNTEHILKYSGLDEPDYMLVYDNDANTLSRWFIIEAIRERGGQYRFILRRDVIADNLSSITQAPTFIEKAKPVSIDDPAIFNKEEMTFNQIKTSETMLQDESKVAWVVGYIPSDAFQTETEIEVRGLLPIEPSYTVAGIENWDYYNLLNTQLPYSYSWSGEYHVAAKIQSKIFELVPFYWYYDIGYYSFNKSSIDSVQVNVVKEGLSGSDFEKEPRYNSTLGYTISAATITLADGLNTQIKQTLTPFYNNNTWESYMQAQVPRYSTSNINYYEQLNGKVIYDSVTDTYWKVEATIKTTKETVNPMYTNNNALFNYAYDILDKEWIDFGSYQKGFTLQFDVSYSYVELTLKQTFRDLNFSIPAAGNRTHLKNAPYDMFCIPYGELEVNDDDNGLTPNFRTQPDIAIAVGQKLAAAEGAGADTIYDVQLLPYCPCRDLLRQQVGYYSLEAYKDASVRYITDDKDNKLSVIVWCDSNEISFSSTWLGGTTQLNKFPQAKKTVEEKKINSETSVWRVVSPNYASTFEFNVEKNNGVRGWDVDCTYKPFNPYIKISPRFAGLYGSDFNDARGLILGGDFSLSRITSAWTDFELRNKNYQAIFDRQVENMEVNNAVQREQQIWNIATGTISAAGSGAMSGAMMGGGVGAAIGGVVGGAASLVGGIRDYQLSETLRNEAIDYSKDQFGYQLGNIQALPYSLGKVGAFNANYKLWPFLEYYTCTETEKQALRDKLKYNGYTIMRIGRIADFIHDEPTYIKGKLIRLEGVGDYHIVNAIAGELDKGVFI